MIGPDARNSLGFAGNSDLVAVLGAATAASPVVTATPGEVGELLHATLAAIHTAISTIPRIFVFIKTLLRVTSRTNSTVSSKSRFRCCETSPLPRGASRWKFYLVPAFRNAGRH